MIIESNQAAHDFNCPYGMCFTLYCKQWKQLTIAFGLNLNSNFFFSPTMLHINSALKKGLRYKF